MLIYFTVGGGGDCECPTGVAVHLIFGFKGPPVYSFFNMLIFWKEKADSCFMSYGRSVGPISRQTSLRSKLWAFAFILWWEPFFFKFSASLDRERFHTSFLTLSFTRANVLATFLCPSAFLSSILCYALCSFIFVQNVWPWPDQVYSCWSLQPIGRVSRG